MYEFNCCTKTANKRVNWGGSRDIYSLREKNVYLRLVKLPSESQNFSWKPNLYYCRKKHCHSRQRPGKKPKLHIRPEWNLTKLQPNSAICFTGTSSPGKKSWVISRPSYTILTANPWHNSFNATVPFSPFFLANNHVNSLEESSLQSENICICHIPAEQRLPTIRPANPFQRDYAHAHKTEKLVWRDPSGMKMVLVCRTAIATVHLEHGKQKPSLTPSGWEKSNFKEKNSINSMRKAE